jgi:hypothetical protein
MGTEVLLKLASRFGIARTLHELTSEIESIVKGELRDFVPFYWNTDGKGMPVRGARLIDADVASRVRPMPPNLTHTERYRAEIQAVGTERFRVKDRVRT